MRGDDLQQDAMFSYVSPEQRVPADHPLRPIRRMVDEVLKGLSRRFDTLYSQHGPAHRLLPRSCCGRCCCRCSTRCAASGC